MTTEQTPNSEPTPEQLAATAVDAYLAKEAADHAAYLGKAPKPVPAAEPKPEAKAAPAAEPAAAVAEPVTEQEPGSAEYTLAEPQGIPLAAYTDENKAVFSAFNAAASGAGIPQPVAESLLDTYINVQHDFLYGAGADDDYTPEQGERVLRGYWGDDYETRIGQVRKTVTALGRKFDDWLTDSQMGNSPSVIVALSHMADMKLTKDQAKAELDKIMASPEYTSDNARVRKPALIRARILGRIAHAD